MKRALSFVFLVAAVPAFSQFTPQPQTTSTTNDQIIVTASALPESLLSTPASATVVTRADIERRASLDVADVLREIPGITLARSGSAGKATSLFTRGAASTQTLVLWNGVEINNPYFAGYDWGRFSTVGVEQIEVVRGPFSALYGSEAMAGVVNVITQPRTSGVRADLQVGGKGLRNGALELSHASPTSRANLAFERRQDDGFNPNDDFRQNSGHASWNWMPSAAFSVGLNARHTSYELGIPFNTNSDATALIPSLERRQSGRESQLAIPLGFTLFGLTNDLSVSESRHKDDFNDPQDPFLTSTATDSKLRRARFSSRSGQTFLGTFIAGAEIERASVTDLTNYGPNFENQRRNGRALFLEDRYTHPFSDETRFELSAGVRRDHFDFFGSQTSPRVAAAMIAGSHKIRAAYGRGFRAPSLGELYYPFFGNPALKAERNRSFEVGYDAMLGKGGLMSLTYFNSRAQDLITFDPITFISENLGRVRSDGLEFGLQHSLGAGSYTAVSYTYLHRNEDEATGERLLRRPKHGGSISTGYRSGAFDTSVTLRRSGTRDDILPIAPFTRVPNSAFTTIDWKVQLRGEHYTPYVKVENVRDKHYEEVLGYASPGRRVIVGLRIAE